MSTVGKVFVVLNLALAALFVGAAASLIGTSQEFRSKYEVEAVAHASDNKVKDMQLGDLQGQVDELSREANPFVSSSEGCDERKNAAGSVATSIRKFLT